MGKVCGEEYRRKGGEKEKNVYKRILLEVSADVFHLQTYISLEYLVAPLQNILPWTKKK
jgi:hypothetical protein